MPKQLDFVAKEWVETDEYDWVVTERNTTTWYPTFFTKEEVSLHQAKGNMAACKNYIEYMESKGWLKPGDVILDPMCGIGSYLRMAALKGYSCFGIELEDRFIEAMEGYDIYFNLGDTETNHVEGGLEKFRRVTRGLPNVGGIMVVQGDARYLEHPTDIANVVICSPPYGNKFRDINQQLGSASDISWKDLEKVDRDTRYVQYSSDPNNIGNCKLTFNENNAYSKEMLKVYKSMYNVLSNGSYVCLITKDFISQKKVVKLSLETIRLMAKAGFKFLERKTTKLPEASFLMRTNWQRHYKDIGLPLIDWEDTTFYVKATNFQKEIHSKEVK